MFGKKDEVAEAEKMPPGKKKTKAGALKSWMMKKKGAGSKV